MTSGIEAQVLQPYKYGFVTDIESDVVPPGLNEDVIRLISRKKGEPEWMLEWRLRAFRHWIKMPEPHWPNVKYAPIDYQAVSYYAAPKVKPTLESLEQVNVTGTAVLLEAMGRHGIGQLVLASSMVVYGEGAYDCAAHGRVRPSPRDPADLAAGRFEPRCPQCAQPLSTATVGEEAPLDPRNVYAASKVAQEHLASSWARLTGGTAVGLRYHNVYGPRMPRDTPYSGVAAIFRSCLENGVPPRVFEDGGQRRDFVHVSDVAQANLLALAATGRAAGGLRCYNVASGEPHTVGEMASALAGAFGGTEPVVTGEYRLGDVRHVVASPEGAARDLGFRARTRFADGIAEFAQAPLREPALARA